MKRIEREREKNNLGLELPVGRSGILVWDFVRARRGGDA